MIRRSGIGSLLTVLDATQPSPSHAPYLLNGEDQLIFDYVGSVEPALREPAHALLVRLSGGEDFGFDVERWRAWARTLTASEPAGPSGS